MRKYKDNSVSSVCEDLIVNGKIYHPLYANGLANHLPMTLLALDKMGASSQILERFQSLYIKRLEYLDFNQKNEVSNISDVLGKRDAFLGVVSFLGEELGKLGVDELLLKYLEFLSPGLSSSVFHSLIRLAYAIESGIQGEIIYSLAYFIIEYRCIGTITYKNISTSDAITGVMRLKKDFHIKQQDLIADEVEQVTKDVHFNEIAFIPNDLSLEKIAKISLNAYLNSNNNFTLLHGITGVHAMRIVLPFFKNQKEALGYFWMAYIAMIITTDVYSLGENHKYQHSSRDLDECIHMAIESIDDHTIKLVYSCWQESVFYKNDRYIEAINMRLIKEVIE